MRNASSGPSVVDTADPPGLPVGAGGVVRSLPGFVLAQAVGAAVGVVLVLAWYPRDP